MTLRSTLQTSAIPLLLLQKHSKYMYAKCLNCLRFVSWLTVHINAPNKNFIHATKVAWFHNNFGTCVSEKNVHLRFFKIEKSIARDLCARGAQPLTIVNQDYFRDFCEVAQPNFKPNSAVWDVRTGAIASNQKTWKNWCKLRYSIRNEINFFVYFKFCLVEFEFGTIL